MMPQLLTVRVKRPDHRPLRIWVPILPVALMFSPLVVLAVVGVIVACCMYHVSVLRALGTGWRIAWALSGARFDIEQGGTAVLVSLR